MLNTYASQHPADQTPLYEAAHAVNVDPMSRIAVPYANNPLLAKVIIFHSNIAKQPRSI